MLKEEAVWEDQVEKEAAEAMHPQTELWCRIACCLLQMDTIAKRNTLSDIIDQDDICTSDQSPHGGAVVWISKMVPEQHKPVDRISIPEAITARRGHCAGSQ